MYRVESNSLNFRRAHRRPPPPRRPPIVVRCFDDLETKLLRPIQITCHCYFIINSTTNLPANMNPNIIILKSRAFVGLFTKIRGALRRKIFVFTHSLLTLSACRHSRRQKHVLCRLRFLQQEADAPPRRGSRRSPTVVSSNDNDPDGRTVRRPAIGCRHQSGRHLRRVHSQGRR